MKKIIQNYHSKFVKARLELLYRIIDFNKIRSVFDLGGGRGHIASLMRQKYPDIKYIIGDMGEDELRDAEAKGFSTLRMDGSLDFPIPNNEFDFVFCNSVIEHVTVPKENIWNEVSNFDKIAFDNQKKFAAEIRRIARSYFVQTPYKYFPVEAHTWFPGLGYLPRSCQVESIRLLNKFWMKKSEPDFRLLNYKDMRTMFPEAEIITTSFLGLPKELIAVK